MNRLTRLTLIALLGSACARPATDVRSGMEALHQERTHQRLLERGKAFASIGDWTRAEQYLAAALEDGGDPDVILPLLLRVCVAGERYRVALSHAHDALERHPEDVRLRYLAASLHLAVGEAEAAAQQLELVLDTEPDCADAHLLLARVLRDRDAEKADEHFREYLRVTPEGAHANEARASLLKTVPAQGDLLP